MNLARIKQLTALVVFMLGSAWSVAQQARPAGEADPPDSGQASAPGEQAADIEQMVLNSPQDLEGVKIVDESGVEVGEVQRAVLRRGTSDVYLVVSLDTFLGLGGEDVVVSVQDLSISGDNVASLSSQEAVRIYVPADFLEVEVAD